VERVADWEWREKEGRKNWHSESKIKYHASKHATQTPHVKGIVIVLKVHQQLGTFKVPTLNMANRAASQSENKSTINKKVSCNSHLMAPSHNST
jgi:hypothetical protein